MWGETQSQILTSILIINYKNKIFFHLIEFNFYEIYWRVVKKVLSQTKISDLSQPFCLCMGPTCTEIKTESLISFSSFIRNASVLPQQKCSAIAPLSGWDSEQSPPPPVYIYLCIYLTFLSQAGCNIWSIFK